MDYCYNFINYAVLVFWRKNIYNVYYIKSVYNYNAIFSEDLLGSFLGKDF